MSQGGECDWLCRVVRAEGLENEDHAPTYSLAPSQSHYTDWLQLHIAQDPPGLHGPGVIKSEKHNYEC